ncbi:unnamed protein product [Protopolystoma xenopodis]|uniref:Uncharacterized protein n=1 Tax=Protopolystoma xenopodis TaxID=117903 RepID=A0A448WCH4_9PLAT|nr:unnamed protein product [Protopolystoma xenopodis]
MANLPEPDVGSSGLVVQNATTPVDKEWFPVQRLQALKKGKPGWGLALITIPIVKILKRGKLFTEREVCLGVEFAIRSENILISSTS